MNSRMPAVQEVVNALQSTGFAQQLQQLLPAGVSQDRFTRTTIVALQNNPSVLEGDRQSLYNAICRAAADGLMPDGKQGALVLYNIKAGDRWVKAVRWMPMVEGIIAQLAKANIPTYAISVYANDHIEVLNDDNGQHITHRPIVFGDRGEFVGVAAVARVGDRTYVETMTVAEIDKVRAASKAADSGPWKTWYDRMAQKSVLHRLKKRLPIVDLAVVDRLRDPEEDDAPMPAQAEEAQPAVEETPPPPPAPRRRSKALDAMVAAEQATPALAPAPEPVEEDLF